MISFNSLDAYFELMKARPEFFAPSENFPIVTNRQELEAWTVKSGKKLGVLYESEYHLLVLDLISDKNGGYFTYERVISNRSGRGVVCVPEYEGKYLFLKQFRHPIRDIQICLPRGFGEDGLDSLQNAEKELYEEIGAKVTDLKFVGTMTADSGFIGNSVDIVGCKVTEYNPDSRDEGILEVLCLTLDEVRGMIKNGLINDSFTICALAKANLI